MLFHCISGEAIVHGLNVDQRRGSASSTTEVLRLIIEKPPQVHISLLFQLPECSHLVQVRWKWEKNENVHLEDWVGKHLNKIGKKKNKKTTQTEPHSNS